LKSRQLADRMTRRYSRVGSHRIVKPARMVMAGVVGFLLALLILPHTPLIHSEKELNAGCWICAVVFAMFAGTYA
jgi:hypothetical protein